MRRVSTDRANIAAVIASFIFAIFLPLELFLFSYTILGPLHYLTELRWLHRKSYFVPNRVYVLGLAIVTVLLVIGYGASSAALLILTAIVIATIANVHTLEKKIATAITGVCAVVIIFSFNPARYLLAVLVPTIIHVSLFSLLFILEGAKKMRTGLPLSVVLYAVAIPVLLFATATGDTSNDLITHLDEAGFYKLSTEVSTFLRSSTFIAGLRILSFMYTFHYLNWFSKSKVIGWSKMNRLPAAIIVLLWLLAVGLYAYDYKLGLTVLFGLSIGHVIFEFPLNIRSIKNLVARK
jgi:hypothetical protein